MSYAEIVEVEECASTLGGELCFPRELNSRQLQVAALLCPIQSNGEPRPDARMPKREHLDALLEGKRVIAAKEEGFPEAEVWSTWVHLFPDAMKWWEELWWNALEDLHERTGEQGRVEKHLGVLTRLARDAYGAYPLACQENFRDVQADFTGDGAATLNLAKRYRIYTWRVEAILVEVWPELNRELLTNPYFRVPGARKGQG